MRLDLEVVRNKLQITKALWHATADVELILDPLQLHQLQQEQLHGGEDEEKEDEWNYVLNGSRGRKATKKSCSCIPRGMSLTIRNSNRFIDFPTCALSGIFLEGSSPPTTHLIAGLPSAVKERNFEWELLGKVGGCRWAGEMHVLDIILMATWWSRSGSGGGLFAGWPKVVPVRGVAFHFVQVRRTRRRRWKWRLELDDCNWRDLLHFLKIGAGVHLYLFGGKSLSRVEGNVATNCFQMALSNLLTFLRLQRLLLIMGRSGKY